MAAGGSACAIVSQVCTPHMLQPCLCWLFALHSCKSNADSEVDDSFKLEQLWLHTCYCISCCRPFGNAAVCSLPTVYWIQLVAMVHLLTFDQSSSILDIFSKAAAVLAFGCPPDVAQQPVVVWRRSLHMRNCTVTRRGGALLRRYWTS